VRRTTRIRKSDVGVISKRFDSAPEALSNGKVVIAVKKGSLTVKLDTIYQMVGTPPRNGKISAKQVWHIKGARR
jgi:hypothetical protein